MNAKFHILTAITMTATAFSPFAYGQPADEMSLPSHSLKKLYQNDQSNRQQFQDKAAWGSDNLKTLAVQDQRRRQQVKEMIKKGSLKTAGDFYQAAMILQHGRDPDDFLLAHILACAAAFKGHKQARWLAAATMDRYLHNIGKAQVFGTQFRTEKLQNERSTWTMNLLDSDLLTDQLRDVYQVPHLSSEIERLSGLNNAR